MQTTAISVQSYLDQLPDDRKEVMKKLRVILAENLPTGFAEMMGTVGIDYSIPHSLYPNGYHCNPKLPLPFITIASQKNFIALYHLGFYLDASLSEWFVTEYSKHVKTKLDMGKSCIRFKKLDQIPFDLLGQLAQKISLEGWIKTYEASLKI